MNPAATPAPIHDIVGPVWFLAWPLWMILCAAAAIVVVVALVTWIAIRLLSRKTPLTAQQRALKELDLLRPGISGADPYQFGVKVSDAIRAYINAQHGLHATTQTSLEFLEAIRGNAVFTDNEKAGLAVFLEKTDLLKFARAEAGESEMIGLLETAGRLVRGEVQPASPGGPKA